jgi:hypothetical protein
MANSLTLTKLGAALVLGLCSCSKSSSPPSYSPDWSSDVAGSCSAAGEVLRKYSCPEASPAGISWEDFCSRAQISEGAIDLDVGCIVAASSVEGVRTCHVRCRK